MIRNRQQLISAVEFARTAARATWLVLTLSLLALVALPHILPAFGREVYVVGGGSMEPAIPVGSVVVVNDSDPSQVRVGEVITFRLDKGTVVTHRVTGISTSDGLFFTTKGDASDTPDPSPVPASALVGEVEHAVPAVGSIIASLSSTAGEVLVLFFLGSLLLAGWFLDELLVTLRRSAPARAVVRTAD